MPTLSGDTTVGAVSGGLVRVYRATRSEFAAGPPTYDSPNLALSINAALSASPDVPAVIAGEAFGGAGQWDVVVDSYELWYVGLTWNGHTAWVRRDATTGAPGGGTGSTAAADITVYQQPGEPPGAIVGDIWVVGDAAPSTTTRFAAFEQFGEPTSADAGDMWILAIADVWEQDTVPSAAVLGDMWIGTAP